MASQIIIGPGEYQQDEREVGADVTPGELVEFAADGRLQPHSSAPDLNGNGSAVPRFAVEARSVGKSIDDTYTYDGTADEGENGHFAHPAPGTPVQAYIATGHSIDPDTPLESAGDGTLQPHAGLDPAGDGTDTIADDLVVAYANEAIDTTGDADPSRHEVISA